MTPLDHLDEVQLLRYSAQSKSPAICALAEVGGIFVGLSGLGVMLAGRVGLGAVCLLTYWGIIAGTVVAFFGGVGWAILAFPPVAAVWCLLMVVAATQAARTHNIQLARRLRRPARRRKTAPRKPLLGQRARLLLLVGAAMVVAALSAAFLLNAP